MASFFLLESGRLLDEAKRAAFDAVGSYKQVTPYTIGVAVQAAAAVLQAGEGLDPTRPPPRTPPRDAAVDVASVEVTPRLRVLESIAAAALRSHGAHAGDDQCCELCAALDQLTALDPAS
jgi:hypothetical protein